MTNRGEKVSSVRWVARAILLFALLGLPAAAQPLEPVTVITGDWPPYVEQSAPGGGILAEVLSAAFAGMGYRADYRFGLFDDALTAAGRDGVAGTFPWFRTEQREQDWVYGRQPLLEVEYVFFVRRPALIVPKLDTASIDTPEDLHGLRFGGVAGYVYPEEVEKRIRPERRYPTEAEAFEALLDRKIDLLQSDFRVGMDFITGPHADRRHDIVVLAGEGLTHRQPLYFVAARSQPGAEDFIAALDDELRRLELAGYLRQLLDRTDRQSRWVVRLSGNDSFPLVVGHRERDNEEAILIPNGTRAVVFEWAERFQHPGPVRVHEDMFVKSRVHLLDGPMRGETVWVQSLYIQLP